ncbi:hypothetical protein HPP92_017336 [Vanilla planifolia]|uniref:Thiol-disulfide oxidoreductase DCC n=1 Tax=Vanilla planifolia TaxID=51239 RepID=A0A835UT10_VANPL|nr:hypothetical protein HPP92_017336 [Vanilla planifolia]
MLKILPAIIRPAALAVALMRSSASGLASAAFDPTVSPPKVNSDPTLLQPRVVIYDCVCHLCHRGVKWVIKVDKDVKIRFCCLQSKAAEPYLLLCGVDREDVQKRMLFIEGPEGCYEGSTAALKVASYLPFPYAALGALLIVPAPLRDAAYDYIASRRHRWFGKSDDCIVKKDVELLERFIDRDELLSREDGDDK